MTPSASCICSTTPALSILTVGDGDLSASLAILRAYYHHDDSTTTQHCPSVLLKRIVATTLLPSREELLETYPTSAPVILQELESHGTTDVKILYQIDATQLHAYTDFSAEKFDLVLFHHPHLGYDDDMSPEEHASRHSALLAHYFASSVHVLNDDGCIHVCLCSGAVKSWRLEEIVQHLNMEVVVQEAASRPLLGAPLVEYFRSAFNNTVSRDDDDEENDKNNQSTRQSSTFPKKIGGSSRKGHWLGRYGYRHQPTNPHVTEFQTNVSNSVHFFLRPQRRQRQQPKEDDTATSTEGYRQQEYKCQICLQTFPTGESLRDHLQFPALPVLSSASPTD